MKTLYLVRHAKSSWKDILLNDFDRPLNERGKHDAPIMGNILSEKNILVDLIISSPAKRAFDTAIIIAEQLKYKSKIKTDENLYDASADEILKTLKNVDEIFHSILIVAHNPGLTSLSNSLTNYYISNIPTCGVVAINFENEWKNLSAGNCRLLFFEYPKKYT